ncbi:MAG: hypothetical protein HFJ10_04830 [Lachnospiraceae bacterium]|nr:hypothetical protein [Lachnospiraceae bacterium]
MKHVVHKKIGFVLALIVAVMFAGCKKSNQDSQNEEAELVQDLSQDTQLAEEETDPREEEAAEARVFYLEVLNRLLVQKQWPDGTEVYFDGFGSMEDNHFAIFDVDQDGREELMLQYTTTSMAGMTEAIYDYDGELKELREEFLQFPMTTYYGNGVIKVGFSHNQGFGPDFWPFFLYQYQADTDDYTCVGLVDTWDKSYYPEAYLGGEPVPFPEEADTDGDGILYYLSDSEEYQLEDPVNKGEYEEWVTSHVGEAGEMEIPWLPLSEESFAQFR